MVQQVLALKGVPRLDVLFPEGKEAFYFKDISQPSNETISAVLTAVLTKIVRTPEGVEGYKRQNDQRVHNETKYEPYEWMEDMIGDVLRGQGYRMDDRDWIRTLYV